MKSGSKVKCVSDFAEWRNRFPNVNYPEKGEVYTIRSFGKRSNGLGVLLEEVKNDMVQPDSYSEPFFSINSFEVVSE